MKRAPFLGAAAAVVLAGCGGRHASQVLPGVAPSSNNQQLRGGMAVAADPVPDNVLAAPILGEAWRFDGAIAPRGWVLAQGQTLKIADNRQLYAILGSRGGDGKTTFTLPLGKTGLIIAVAGYNPDNPQVFTKLGRHISLQDSLGSPSARSAVRAMKTVPAELLAERRLAASAIRAAEGRSAPVSGLLKLRIEQSVAQARRDMFASLASQNRTSLEDALAAAAAGRSRAFDVVLQTAAALSDEEAVTLLRVNDSLYAGFRPGWRGMVHENLRLEAARFAVSVGFTPEQLSALRRREST